MKLFETRMIFIHRLTRLSLGKTKISDNGMQLLSGKRVFMMVNSTSVYMYSYANSFQSEVSLFGPDSLMTNRSDHFFVPPYDAVIHIPTKTCKINSPIRIRPAVMHVVVYTPCLECTFVSPLGLVNLKELDLERTTVGDDGLDVLSCM